MPIRNMQSKIARPCDTFPLARDELFKYDVLVLGDVDPRLLPRSIWPELREFVTEKGGGVVFIAGPRFLPWDYGDLPDVAPLLPFDSRRRWRWAGRLPVGRFARIRGAAHAAWIAAAALPIGRHAGGVGADMAAADALAIGWCRSTR